MLGGARAVQAAADAGYAARMKPEPPADLYARMAAAQPVPVRRTHGWKKRVECLKVDVDDGRCCFVKRDGRRCKDMRVGAERLCPTHAQKYY